MKLKRVLLDLDPKLVEAIDESAWKNRTTRVGELRNVLLKVYLDGSDVEQVKKEVKK